MFHINKIISGCSLGTTTYVLIIYYLLSTIHHPPPPFLSRRQQLTTFTCSVHLRHHCSLRFTVCSRVTDCHALPSSLTVIGECNYEVVDDKALHRCEDSMMHFVRSINIDYYYFLTPLGRYNILNHNYIGQPQHLARLIIT